MSLTNSKLKFLTSYFIVLNIVASSTGIPLPFHSSFYSWVFRFINITEGYGPSPPLSLRSKRIQEKSQKCECNMLITDIIANFIVFYIHRLTLSYEEPPPLSKSRVFFLNISWFGLNVMYLILSVEGNYYSEADLGGLSVGAH